MSSSDSEDNAAAQAGFDSDDESTMPKRICRITPSGKCDDMPGQAKANPAIDSKRSVWSKVLQDQTLQDAILGVDVIGENDTAVSRGPESFSVEKPDNSVKSTTERSCKNSGITTEQLDTELDDYREQKDDTHLEKASVRNAASTDQKEQSSMYDPDKLEGKYMQRAGAKPPARKRKVPNRPNIIDAMEKSPQLKPTDPPPKVGVRIARALGEQKINLIVQCVQYLGTGKAIELFKRTNEIEESGGMMTLNSARRRSKGGVYLHLVKELAKESEDMKSVIDQIFQSDNKRTILKAKKNKKKNRADKVQEHISNMGANTGFDSDLMETMSKIKQLKQAKDIFLEEALAVHTGSATASKDVSEKDNVPTNDDVDDTVMAE